MVEQCSQTNVARFLERLYVLVLGILLLARFGSSPQSLCAINVLQVVVDRSEVGHPDVLVLLALLFYVSYDSTLMLRRAVIGLIAKAIAFSYELEKARSSPGQL